MIFYYMYSILEILRFKICIKNCVKSKWEEQKETKGIIISLRLSLLTRPLNGVSQTGFWSASFSIESVSGNV